VLVGVATLGVLVQVVAVSTQYVHYIDVAKGLSGVPLYETREGLDPEKIPYGDDPTRWVPEMSALLIQSEGLLSSQLIERLSGDGLKVTYAPFEGRSRTVDLSTPRYRMGLDFWWVHPLGNAVLDRIFAALLAIVAVGSAVLLYLLSFGRRPPWTAIAR
jgi:hypothetical protein